jgi:hypothetical protein
LGFKNPIETPQKPLLGFKDPIETPLKSLLNFKDPIEAPLKPLLGFKDPIETPLKSLLSRRVGFAQDLGVVQLIRRVAPQLPVHGSTQVRFRRDRFSATGVFRYRGVRGEEG